MKAFKTPVYVEYYQGGKWYKILNVGATLKAADYESNYKKNYKKHFKAETERGAHK